MSEKIEVPILATDRIWHGILYGGFGVGKSHAFSTFASKDRPIVVAHFDARGKEIPYFLRDRGGVLLPDEFEDKHGTRYKEVHDVQGHLLARIEYYHDPEYDAPTAIGKFRERINRLAKEYEKGKFWGFILDSVTAFSLRARKYQQYHENAGAKTAVQWYGGETDEVEDVVLLHLPQLPCTVGIAMHVSEKKIEAEGKMLRSPAVRARNQESLGTQWPEIYRVWVDETEGGKKTRRFMVENDEKWIATTVLGVRNGAKAEWASIEGVY